MPLLIEDARDLVEWGASPKVNQKEHMLLVTKRADGVKQLLVHVIRAHVGRQNDSGDVFLRTKDHLSRLFDAFGERTVACQDNSDHPISS